MKAPFILSVAVIWGFLPFCWHLSDGATPAVRASNDSGRAEAWNQSHCTADTCVRHTFFFYINHLYLCREKVCLNNSVTSFVPRQFTALCGDYNNLMLCSHWICHSFFTPAIFRRLFVTVLEREFSQGGIFLMDRVILTKSELLRNTQEDRLPLGSCCFVSHVRRPKQSEPQNLPGKQFLVLHYS